MPWTEITRPQYDRRTLGYASDGADKQWALDRTVHARWLQSRASAPDAPMRRVWNAIQWIAAMAAV